MALWRGLPSLLAMSRSFSAISIVIGMFERWRISLIIAVIEGLFSVAFSISSRSLERAAAVIDRLHLFSCSIR